MEGYVLPGFVNRLIVLVRLHVYSIRHNTCTNKTCMHRILLLLLYISTCVYDIRHLAFRGSVRTLEHISEQLRASEHSFF